MTDNREKLRLAFEEIAEKGYTTQEADGALKNGRTVRKVNSEEGDGNPDGSIGTVLGSISHEEHGPFYFVRWDRMAYFAVGVMAKKVEAVEE